MNLLQEAYTALLSGLTSKTGNEIHWQDENGNPITIEPVDVNQCKYIVRSYYKNGQKSREIEYRDGELHGKYICWHENGQKSLEKDYRDGKLHGKAIGWFENGQKAWELEYCDGIFVRKIKLTY